MKNLVKQFCKIVIVIAVLCGIIWIVYQGKSGEQAEAGAYQAATVLYVIDGDTVDVSLDGEDVRVRMVGINTPESASKEEGVNTPKGAQASAYVTDLLPKGTTVYLEYDEERQDKYGRTLAYLWTSNQMDTASFKDFCKYNIGAVIMQNTYCEAMYVKPNGRYYDWYKQLEKNRMDNVM